MRAPRTTGAGSARTGVVRLATVVVLGVCAVVVAGVAALPWKDSVGGGNTCVYRDPPYTPPYEAWLIQPEQSVWPLGIRCVWIDPLAQRTISQDPDWGGTVVALTSLGVAATWIVSQSRPRWSARGDWSSG